MTKNGYVEACFTAARSEMGTPCVYFVADTCRREMAKDDHTQISWYALAKYVKA